MNYKIVAEQYRVVAELARRLSENAKEMQMLLESVQAGPSEGVLMMWSERTGVAMATLGDLCHEWNLVDADDGIFDNIRKLKN